MQNILHCNSSVLSIVINIQNTTIFKPVIIKNILKYRDDLTMN